MPVFYAGSFNPFTTGHASIVERALEQFDSVIVAVGVNIHKPDGQKHAEERAEMIRRLYANQPRVHVITYHGLTAIAAVESGATALVRGVRNSTDFEAEYELAAVNRHINGIETILLPALPELSCVSSSMVREIQAFGGDATEFLPPLPPQ